MDRRTFVAASLLASATVESACAKENPNYAQLASLVGRSADVRQLWDIDAYSTRPLGAIKNAFNGYESDFGIARARIAIAACLHGYGNALAYNDAMWAKYDIGRTFGFKDPTGGTLTGNVFYHARSSGDISLETLAGRGAILLACDAAAAEHASSLVAGNAAPAGMSTADVHADLRTNLMPGVALVPSMVATIGLLQTRFGYAYTTTG